MRAITDHVYAGRDQSVPPLTEAQGPERPMDAPSAREDSYEAIER
jgi:hypothetical protein